jgi:hypothetical protein
LKALYPVQTTFQREINPAAYSLDEFRRRVTRDDSFVSAILAQPKLFLVGSENELRELTQNQ